MGLYFIHVQTYAVCGVNSPIRFLRRCSFASLREIIRQLKNINRVILFPAFPVPNLFGAAADKPERQSHHEEEQRFIIIAPAIFKVTGVYIQQQKTDAKVL